jgi:dolichol-phosphate mannosyltransferase
MKNNRKKSEKGQKTTQKRAIYVGGNRNECRQLDETAPFRAHPSGLTLSCSLVTNHALNPNSPAGGSVFPSVHLAIVCPMANESQSAVKFVREVLSYCGSFAKVDFFIVLDKVSKDNTLELLRAEAVADPRIKPVWAPENRCIVDAYIRGYREALAAGAGWILEIDAGFSHRPADIPLFFETMAQGYDCVFATRFAKGGKIVGSSFQREMISRGGTILTNLLLNTKLSDMTSGFQLFKGEVLEKILTKGIYSRGPFFQTEMKAYCYHLHFAEIPITYSMASHAVGSASIKESFQQLWRLFELRRSGKLAI